MPCTAGQEEVKEYETECKGAFPSQQSRRRRVVTCRRGTDEQVGFPGAAGRLE